MNAIEIRLDDTACVGCGLCAEVCPTKVFDFSEAENLPKVKHPQECFGCLSCSEICPATALRHDGNQLSQSYYHTPAALALANRIGTPPIRHNVPQDSQSLGNAVADLGNRLLSVAAVLKHTLGQSLAAVGTMAGMSLATQLPRYQSPASFEESLQLLVKTFAPAWEITPTLNGTDLVLNVQTCFVRDLCGQHKLELGGDLCTLFYNYLAGYLAKIGGVRPRFTSATRGAQTCSYAIKLYPAHN
jgi:NAD-dependent dihydropyrimidine dehydrogenase PreA subunit